jgi:hypothetical protein
MIDDLPFKVVRSNGTDEGAGQPRRKVLTTTRPTDAARANRLPALVW